MNETVTLIDVSTRDGFQDEPCFVATDEKVEVVRAIAAAGVREIEATSFVHPKWVPQLADADALVPRLPKDARLAALVLNVRGYERAREAFAAFSPGSYDLVFVVSASRRHHKANNNRQIEESLDIFDAIARPARAAGIAMCGAIACAFVSPYPDEAVDAETVRAIADRYTKSGVVRITLADTVGRADPFTVSRRLAEVQKATPVRLSMHLHDSFGFGLANVFAGLQAGVRSFEGALAGLGGCPFAPDAPGNLDLESLRDFVEACGFDTGIDREKLALARQRVRAAVNGADPLLANTGKSS